MISNENDGVGEVGYKICIEKRWISLQSIVEYNAHGSHALPTLSLFKQLYNCLLCLMVSPGDHD